MADAQWQQQWQQRQAAPQQYFGYADHSQSERGAAQPAHGWGEPLVGRPAKRPAVGPPLPPGEPPPLPPGEAPPPPHGWLPPPLPLGAWGGGAGGGGKAGAGPRGRHPHPHHHKKKRRGGSEAAAEIESLPTAENYLDGYPAVRSLIQQFKCAAGLGPVQRGAGGGQGLH